MVEAEYWKIKAQLLQYRLEEMQLEASFNDLTNRRIKFSQDNNIPLQNLRFDDNTFTIEEIKNGQ